MSSQDLLSAGSARLEVDFNRDRNRLTTFFQPLLALPQYFVLFIATLPLCFVVVYAWFALLVTARWPRGPFRWVAGWLRAATRWWAYFTLVSARHPPWTIEDDPSYEVRLRFGAPQPRYSRLKILFRCIFAIPAYFVCLLAGMLLYVLTAVSWLWIVITGRQSDSVFRLQRGALSLFTLYSLLINLVIEEYDWELSGAGSD